jgi:predicted RNA-binding Zn ribbon-like protein
VAGAIEHAELETRGAAARAVAWEFEELESPLWPVAHAAYDLLTGPQVHRLKRCAGCPWLFLDQSKNGSRRWCSMEICGTSEKIRRYVSRRAERRTS